MSAGPTPYGRGNTGSGSFARLVLPVDAVLPQLVEALQEVSVAVVVAAPGAGKTTRVPPALLDAPWNDGRVIVVEPRRVAARAAAQRMASERNEPLGATVGLRMRHDTVVSQSTRIEVVTEGVLVRMLQRDPALDGVSAVILDEFHERSLDVDLALALLLDVRAHLRADLRVVVMSATLDIDAVTKVLTGPKTADVEPVLSVPVISVASRVHQVTVEHRPPAGVDLSTAAAQAALQAIQECPGDVLVFLAGVREIRRAQRHIEDRSARGEVVAIALHGGVGPDATARAIAPSNGIERRIVLATTIAQTSVTIDGVTTVVDSGRQRAPRLDEASGWSRLATVSVSVATADQRAGRAGRTGPGRCIRLWSATDQRSMPLRDRPQILDADLAGLVLTLAAWGTDAGDLAWCDAPPPPALQRAVTLLHDLGAIDSGGRITALGSVMADAPLEPRLARLLWADGHVGDVNASGAESSQSSECAIALAALLSEPSPYRGGPPAHISARLLDCFGDPARLADRGVVLDPGALDRLHRVRRDLRRLRGMRGAAPLLIAPTITRVGALLAAAFPDRLAVHNQDRPGTYETAGGTQARLPDGDPLTGERLLVAVEVDADRRSGRIFAAEPVRLEWLIDAISHTLRADHVVTVVDGEVHAADNWYVGDLLVSSTRVAPSPADTAEVLLARVRAAGTSVLSWTEAAQRMQARLDLAHRTNPTRWPAVSEAGLLEALDDWLGAELREVHHESLDAVRVDRALLRLAASAGGRSALDRYLPTEVTLPSGGTRAVRYAMGEAPRVATAVRDLFGSTSTPTVADGQVRIVLELLSPAARPVAVTDDLARFWATGYPAVRTEMRGRYPRHPWPEDPRTASPQRPQRPQRGS